MTIITNTTSMIAELHKLHSESKGQEKKNQICQFKYKKKKDLNTQKEKQGPDEELKPGCDGKTNNKYSTCYYYQINIQLETDVIRS